jgi:hypothetical protein
MRRNGAKDELNRGIDYRNHKLLGFCRRDKVQEPFPCSSVYPMALVYTIRRSHITLCTTCASFILNSVDLSGSHHLMSGQVVER